MDLVNVQKKIEKDAYDYSYQRFMNEIQKRIKQDSAHELPEGMMLIKATIDLVSNKIDDYFKAPLKGLKNRERMLLSDWFENTDGLALIAINAIISSCSKEPYVPVTRIARNIAKYISQHHIMLSLTKQLPKLTSYLEREYKSRGKRYIQSRKLKLGKMKASFNEDLITRDGLMMGTTVLDLVLKSGANLVETSVIMENKNKKQSVIMFTQETLQLISLNRANNLINFQKYPIFVVPPQDWKGITGNLGYYDHNYYHGMLIKTKGKNKKLLKQYFQTKSIPKYIEIVNRIQKTKWKINKNIYEVMNTIIDSNLVEPSSPRNNPSLLGGLPYCLHQDVSDYVKASDFGEVYTEGKYAGYPVDRESYRQWYKATEIQKEKILVNRSKAIMLFLALSDAKAYLNYPAIYFSYQACFRGRLYPVQQHLNPQLKGYIKSLLEFSEGVPIENEEQEAWFYVHGANCFGFDKLEYEERIEKILALTKEIEAIVENPYKNVLWTEADEPFMFLAWCYEFVAYSKNPTEFRSTLPISLDATCSGIQVYSGLLLDGEGATAVNVRGETRQDIYQKVADKVNYFLSVGDYNKSIQFKKSDGTEHLVPTIVEANSLKGKITRTLTKRNTMTQPYSVTRYGMYQQLLEELNAMEDSNNVIWEGDKWVVARVLTELNDKAIVEIVKGARVGQEFLKQMTSIITKRGEYIFYTTPFFEFPVLQKIHKTAINRVKTQFGSLAIRSELENIDGNKMINGIAPNYIHSLDATLMFLTVDKLKDCNSFHLIHDSFGVPINQVEQLNEAVREAYVELFESKPLLRFIKQVNPEAVDLVDEIMINTLDLKDVYDSKYIFS